MGEIWEMIAGCHATIINVQKAQVAVSTLIASRLHIG